MSLISLTVARAFFGAGSFTQKPTIQVAGDGVRIFFRVGMELQPLESSRRKGQERVFKSIDAAARLLRSIGIAEANLQMEQWRPEQKGF